VKHWQDGDMRKRLTAAGMLVAEQQFRRSSATATSPSSSSPSSITPSAPPRRTPTADSSPSPLPSDHQPRGSPPKFHDDPDILSVIGEIVTVPRDAPGGDGPRLETIGYAAFVARRSDDNFARWFRRLAADIEALATRSGVGAGRLIELQRSLIDVIDLLDPRSVRIPATTRHKLGRTLVSAPHLPTSTETSAS
jgi:hypothetical protein